MTGAHHRPPPITSRRGTLMTAMTLTGSMGAIVAAPRRGLDGSAVTGTPAAMGTPAVQARLSHGSGRAGGPCSGPSNPWPLEDSRALSGSQLGAGPSVAKQKWLNPLRW